MQNNTHNTNDPMIRNAMKIAGTPQGQQFISLLRSSSGKALDIALNKAAVGDYTDMQKLLSGILDKPEAKELLKQLGR